MKALRHMGCKHHFCPRYFPKLCKHLQHQVFLEELRVLFWLGWNCSSGPSIPASPCWGIPSVQYVLVSHYWPETVAHVSQPQGTNYGTVLNIVFHSVFGLAWSLCCLAKPATSCQESFSPGWEIFLMLLSESWSFMVSLADCLFGQTQAGRSQAFLCKERIYSGWYLY